MKSKIIYRVACKKDVLAIHELEVRVWGENAASEANLMSRIETFPTGNVIAISGEQVVGYVSTVIISEKFADNCKTWYEYTDSGNAKKCFDPNGKLLFGTSLTVDEGTRNTGIGSSLLLRVARMCIENNLKAGILGGRIPYYYKMKTLKVEDYLKLKEKDGKIFDPELRLYLRMGLKIVRVQDNYFEDPESLNYGVILRWNNPFYRITSYFPFLSKPLSYLFNI